jgi:hypothetical protein
MPIHTFALHVLVVVVVVWIPLGTLYLNMGLFSFPAGAALDPVPKSTLLYHSLLNRDCNLVYAAPLPSVFSPAQDAHL